MSNENHGPSLRDLPEDQRKRNPSIARAFLEGWHAGHKSAKTEASPSTSALAIAEQLEHSARILRVQHADLWVPVTGHEDMQDVHMRHCRENHLGCAYLQAIEGMEQAAALLRAGQQEQKEQP